jgi:hypothetical protein
MWINAVLISEHKKIHSEEFSVPEKLLKVFLGILKTKGFNKPHTLVCGALYFFDILYEKYKSLNISHFFYKNASK